MGGAKIHEQEDDNLQVGHGTMQLPLQLMVLNGVFCTEFLR
jgi:hypothetical protein